MGEVGQNKLLESKQFSLTPATDIKKENYFLHKYAFLYFYILNLNFTKLSCNKIQ